MKQVIIVFEEGGDHDRGRYLCFQKEDAKIVEDAIFSAEAKGALGAHFTLSDGKVYWMRTDKYLYWFVEDVEEPAK